MTEVYLQKLFLLWLKRQDASGKKEITVLDTKRSNAINIGLTVLPPPRTIKTAILKMDTSIMNKEGIEVRLLIMHIIMYILFKVEHFLRIYSIDDRH